MMLKKPKKHPNAAVQYPFATLIENVKLMEKELSLQNTDKNLFCCKTIETNLLVINPENIQLIQPPIIIIGNTFVRLLLSISVIIVGSVIIFCVCVFGRFCVRYPSSSLLNA